eukprot:4214582-Amphidinium_carterae.1
MQFIELLLNSFWNSPHGYCGWTALSSSSSLRGTGRPVRLSIMDHRSLVLDRVSSAPQELLTMLLFLTVIVSDALVAARAYLLRTSLRNLHAVSKTRVRESMLHT